MNKNGRNKLFPGQCIHRTFVGLNDALLDDIEAEIIATNKGFSETVRGILQAYFEAKKQNSLAS